MHRELEWARPRRPQQLSSGEPVDRAELRVAQDNVAPVVVIRWAIGDAGPHPGMVGRDVNCAGDFASRSDRTCVANGVEVPGYHPGACRESAVDTLRTMAGPSRSPCRTEAVG
jgi:hypothetical protein